MAAKLLFALLFATVGAFASADELPAPSFQIPELQNPVNDQAGILDGGAVRALNAGLRTLRDQTGTQITVLTVPSLGGLSIEEASIKVTDKWRLIQDKKERGVLLVVAPNEHKVRIEVARGLEGDLTDALSNRIIRDTILPHFRENDFTGGVAQGLVEIIHRTDPSVDAQSLFSGVRSSRAESAHEGGRPSIWFILLVLFFVIFILPRGGFFFFGGGGGGGGWGGGGGFGGGGGGSWGGGGGGGFSGGGSSGSW